MYPLKRTIILSIFAIILIPLAVLAHPFNYTVANKTNGALGTVTLWCSTHGTTINIPSSGNYVTEVPGTVTAVSVNGFVAYYPTTTPITLANGHPGQVAFNSTSRVEIIDLLEGAN